jgi:DNA-binding FadR family transcriptional regulator
LALDVSSHSILQYIVNNELAGCIDDTTKLPSMGALAKELGVSRGKLREDMITAQAFGMVDMRPGDGTYIRPFDFYTAIRPLVLYSVICDQSNFGRFYKLRAQLEVAFWEQAVAELDPSDLDELQRVLAAAEQKLGGRPVEIPHKEHREFHLLVYDRLDNPFVQGLLKAYWDAYEAVGLHRYFDLSYYERMWSSHNQMVQAIIAGQVRDGREVLLRHFTLLEDRLQDSP